MSREAARTMGEPAGGHTAIVTGANHGIGAATVTARVRFSQLDLQNQLQHI